MTTQQHPQDSRKLSRALRTAGWVLLAAVLALSFAGYLSTDLRLQWENIAALCGF
ncbi:hypothetical protein [Paracandidimonas soli]|uniref:Uncharacterized protein n=1 Tax=Paracandidimonas soli TaxID=1917182 RepID=A0A4R3V4E4_9BURK|nr:hypothetical protein [Paracandidimonas soli]TCU97184.1 hypothetical protein EV686_10664 [Paracandidimonas soli]